MRVTDVMSTNVRRVDARETIEYARKLMNDAGVRHLVVFDGLRMTGLVSADQLDRGAAEGILRVEDVMRRHVRCAAPETTVPRAAALLRADFGGALPIGHDDHVVGIVTASDLLDVIARGGRLVPADTRKRSKHRKSPTPATVIGARIR
jgi:CBS-domain-containing membrane protein